jgi:hypothetical protein
MHKWVSTRVTFMKVLRDERRKEGRKLLRKEMKKVLRD